MPAPVALKAGAHLHAYTKTGPVSILEHHLTSCCRGRYWTGIRAACEPLFHSEQLQTYVPIASKAVDAMLDKLANIQPDEPVEINLTLAGFTMDTIGSTAFGWVPCSMATPVACGCEGFQHMHACAMRRPRSLA